MKPRRPSVPEFILADLSQDAGIEDDNHRAVKAWRRWWWNRRTARIRRARRARINRRGWP